MNKIKIYLDTADINEILKSKTSKIVSGYTTNPSLMKKNNIKEYKHFIKFLCSKISKPISFEIFADNDNEIYVEVSGKKDGIPIIFVHGGPGGHCRSEHHSLFDPSVYKSIIFDQNICKCVQIT